MDKERGKEKAIQNSTYRFVNIWGGAPHVDAAPD
jgi:hypothetical protein